jgi:predicted Zn-dependent peptidase
MCLQETVSSLSKSTLVDFIKGNFLGSRMAVAGTGAVSADALVRTSTSKHNPQAALFPQSQAYLGAN